MAIINDEEEGYKTKNTPVSGGTSYIGSGFAGGKNTNPEPAQQSSQRGSGFINLQNYLQGGAGDAMANSLVSNVNDAGTKAENEMENFTTDINKEIAGGTPVYNADTRPTNLNYQGPTSYNTPGYQKAQGAVAGAQEQAKSLGSWQGIQGQLMKTPGMTEGAANLGAFLARSGSGAQKLDQTSHKYDTMGEQLQNRGAAATSAIGAAQQKAADTSQKWAEHDAAIKTYAERLAEERAAKESDARASEMRRAQKQATEAARQAQVDKLNNAINAQNAVAAAKPVAAPAPNKGNSHWSDAVFDYAVPNLYDVTHPSIKQANPLYAPMPNQLEPSKWSVGGKKVLPKYWF